jgi:hypothetical protein
MNKWMQVEIEINLVQYKFFSDKYCFVMWQLFKNTFYRNHGEALKCQLVTVE